MERKNTTAPPPSKDEHEGWVVGDRNTRRRIWLALSEPVQQAVFRHFKSPAATLFKALKSAYEYSGASAEFYARQKYDNTKISNHKSIADYPTVLVNLAHHVNKEITGNQGRIEDRTIIVRTAPTTGTILTNFEEMWRQMNFVHKPLGRTWVQPRRQAVKGRIFGLTFPQTSLIYKTEVRVTVFIDLVHTTFIFVGYTCHGITIVHTFRESVKMADVDVFHSVFGSGKLHVQDLGAKERKSRASQYSAPGRRDSLFAPGWSPTVELQHKGLDIIAGCACDTDSYSGGVVREHAQLAPLLFCAKRANCVLLHEPTPTGYKSGFHFVPVRGFQNRRVERTNTQPFGRHMARFDNSWGPPTCSGCLILGKYTEEYAVPELGAMSAAHRVSKLLRHQRKQHTDREGPG
ncbi:uncharacterized protein EI90DRAFT_3287441 [Cantharellus anzutake]|uniref:uncharacterized protein n=1 Tax=Cantharellus anzutake TaxID=1750568 RepID=UPI0019048611|nr:uncharacterized protein EI90DRAFT_3287441 [Cantharellus anzutake]KAF8336325.1 hypothetical protein EI90DRAFT_3287441 [Cantharellus anzutake]